MMSSEALASAFSIRRVALINDFFAVALGVPLLAPDDLVSLNAGTRVAKAPIAILGAGTGLGEAALVHDGVEVRRRPGRRGPRATSRRRTRSSAASSPRCIKKYGHV